MHDRHRRGYPSLLFHWVVRIIVTTLRLLIMITSASCCMYGSFLELPYIGKFCILSRLNISITGPSSGTTTYYTASTQLQSGLTFVAVRTSVRRRLLAILASCGNFAATKDLASFIPD